MATSYHSNFSPWSQLTALKFDNELRLLTEERAILADRLAFLPESDPAAATIKDNLKKYDEAIHEKTINIYAELNRQDNPPIKVLGNDISYDYTDFSLNSKLTPSAKTRKELRKKIHFLTRRLAWKVRANQDNNLFIVDDTYDKDYDIQAFEQSFANLSIFKSEYTTALQQISEIAKKLKLEVFCNTQGHIEIRNPKYNRIPSSVFYRMLQQKDETGVQIFPQFLEDLFTTQIKDIYKQLEILEDKIRLYCASLGYVDDGQATVFINSIDASSRFGGGKFSFLSDNNGEIYKNIPTIKSASTPDYLDGVDQQLTVSTFSSIGRAKYIQSGSQPPAGVGSNKFKSLQEIRSLLGATQRFDTIKARLAIKSGETFSLEQEFASSNADAVKSPQSNLVTLQITNKLAQILSDRSLALQGVSSALKNLKEGLTLDSRAGSNQLLFPELSKKKDVPQMFEHMIEDESYDDLGVGSGKRYVLKNRDIISYSIGEKKPTFTAVNVVGTFDLQKLQLPSDLALAGSNGNALSTATAVDYDLWRMYGISLPQDVNAPFLHNPETQMAPYAVALLNKARKEVLKGDISIVGNEYQQPGETVYIENRDLLFYVESVSHTFSFGKSFNTSMSLSYGHNPGEYIPTPLDVIGKVLYKNNKILPRLDHKRQGNVFKQENLGAIAVGLLPVYGLDVFTNPLSEINRNVLNQVVSQAAATLSLASKELKPILELRVYYNSKSSLSSANSRLQSFAEDIKTYLLGGGELEGDSVTAGGKKDLSRLMSFSKTDQIKVIAVDSSPEKAGEFRYPSRKAFYLSKLVVDKIASGKELTQPKIDTGIHDHIIDIWIYFENPNQKK
jgi:hypothetical protein